MSAPKFDADAFLARLWAIDEALAAHDVPRFSPWWRQELTRVVRAVAAGQGRMRAWVIRAGRRAGKSTALEKLAIAWALYGPWKIPSTERATIPFLSTDKDEAGERIEAIKKKLRLLGIPFTPRGMAIELTGKPVRFVVFAATSTAVVGGTYVLIVEDELAKWENRESHSNPAQAVDGSISPGMATQPFAFRILSSSPWLVNDFHAECFDQGNTEHQLVSFAESWVANPTLTPESCRGLARTQREYLREYCAIPQSSQASSFFEPFDAVEGSVNPDLFNGQLGERALLDLTAFPTLDQAFGSLDGSVGHDNFGCCAVTHQAGPLGELGHRRPPRVVVHEVGEWRTTVTPTESAQRVRAFCARYGTRNCYMDQASGLAFAELLKQQGLFPKIVPWTHSSRRRPNLKVRRDRTAPQYAAGGLTDTSKLGKFIAVRSAFNDGRVVLPSGIKHVIQQLQGIQSELAPSGVERIIIPRTKGSHSDAAVALVLGISIALEHMPQLPRYRMTEWERAERARARRRMSPEGLLGPEFGATTRSRPTYGI